MINDPQTYFGLWSAKDIHKVTSLLKNINVRFEINEFEAAEDILKEWCAWDAESSSPHIGFDLWIWSEDLPKVGDKIVTMFPERKFGAS